MSNIQNKLQLDSSTLTSIFNDLKSLYKVNEINEERKALIENKIKKYGYLPYSFYKALKELTIAETLVGLEEKFKQNGIYSEGKFNFSNETISPIQRAGYKDSSWLTKEQLNIKLLNLTALGDGNSNNQETGKFKDWLKQLLILPSGNIDFGVLGTVMYFVPFHPRDFGCAYLPKSKHISPLLEEKELTDKLNLDLSNQLKVFLMFCQLAGHPTMYDVLPQTGRYSATVLAKPYIARWFNIPELNKKLEKALDEIEDKLDQKYTCGSVSIVKPIILNSLNGVSDNTPCDLSHIEEEMENLLDEYRIKYSNKMTSKENQQLLNFKVREIIAEELGCSFAKELSEEDIIPKQNEIIQKLISQGYWPAPGGAWCSCGIPVYDRMVAGGGHPLFKHFDVECKDVSHYANLDCQTPYYFVFFENGEYNRPVIDFWCEFLYELQAEYNFDAFRVDHIDHVVDSISQTPDGKPISYRVPAIVLSEAIQHIRKHKKHFGTLAEYMLWDGLLKEYHQDMGFDLLWGTDIIFQYQKSIGTIINDNNDLINYNKTVPEGFTPLSILKTYNNQDGEFREIDQYPSQMGVDGAIFKWFKIKFSPSGPQAERPAMYLDGDESFTANGTEKVICEEIPLERNNDEEFYRRFDAINRFAKKDIFCRYGVSEIQLQTPSSLVAWCIKKVPEFGDDERLFIVANDRPPHQVIRKTDALNQLYSDNESYKTINGIKIGIPDGFYVVSEFVLPDDAYDYIENTNISNLNDNILSFETLEPSEFHFYRIRR